MSSKVLENKALNSAWIKTSFSALSEPDKIKLTVVFLDKPGANSAKVIFIIQTPIIPQFKCSFLCS